MFLLLVLLIRMLMLMLIRLILLSPTSIVCNTLVPIRHKTQIAVPEHTHKTDEQHSIQLWNKVKVKGLCRYPHAHVTDERWTKISFQLIRRITHASTVQQRWKTKETGDTCRCKTNFVERHLGQHGFQVGPRDFVLQQFGRFWGSGLENDLLIQQTIPKVGNGTEQIAKGCHFGTSSPIDLWKEWRRRRFCACVVLNSLTEKITEQEQCACCGGLCPYWMIFDLVHVELGHSLQESHFFVLQASSVQWWWVEDSYDVGVAVWWYTEMGSRVNFLFGNAKRSEFERFPERHKVRNVRQSLQTKSNNNDNNGW